LTIATRDLKEDAFAVRRGITERVLGEAGGVDERAPTSVRVVAGNPTECLRRAVDERLHVGRGLAVRVVEVHEQLPVPHRPVLGSCRGAGVQHLAPRVGGIRPPTAKPEVLGRVARLKLVARPPPPDLGEAAEDRSTVTGTSLPPVVHEPRWAATDVLARRSV